MTVEVVNLAPYKMEFRTLACVDLCTQVPEVVAQVTDGLWLFVLGIGFFTLCFLMTSLGGQFSARHVGDSPFTIRTEVLGGLESRGVLRKMSDLLELMVKRMDVLARLENSSEVRRPAGDGHFAVDREPREKSSGRVQGTGSPLLTPPGHRHSGLLPTLNPAAVARCSYTGENHVASVTHVWLLCFGMICGFKKKLLSAPTSSLHPHCTPPPCNQKEVLKWMRARWTSDPCYAFFGVDGTECSFLVYLSEVEWFCPPLPWRNQTAAQTAPKTLPKVQAVFRSNLTHLLELVGSGKESLIFMKKRTKRLTAQWALAAQRLQQKLGGARREQKQILVHIGFLTEESGDVFSPRVLKGGPLGEMVQWADILAALYVLGHGLRITVSLKELQSNLGVPPGRGNCPLTAPLPFDLIYTDYHGLQQMKQYMGPSFKKYRCRIRVIDTFGTEPAYNHEEYATLHGYRTNWGYWNLNPKQFMTMFHSHLFLLFQGKEKFLSILNKYMEIHGTVYYESQRPPEVPAFVKNHGLLPQPEFQQLLRKAKLFIGFGFPYEGPAPLEAIANGCIFLQSRFSPPHSSLNHEFFRGKPTSREVFSQHPYAENFIGKPHVWTVDYNNSEEFEAAIKVIMRTQVDPYLPYEYTCEGMLERIHAYIQHQLPPSANGQSLSSSRGGNWVVPTPSPPCRMPHCQSTETWSAGFNRDEAAAHPGGEAAADPLQGSLARPQDERDPGSQEAPKAQVESFRKVMEDARPQRQPGFQPGETCTHQEPQAPQDHPVEERPTPEQPARVTQGAQGEQFFNPVKQKWKGRKNSDDLDFILQKVARAVELGTHKRYGENRENGPRLVLISAPACDLRRFYGPRDLGDRKPHRGARGFRDPPRTVPTADCNLWSLRGEHRFLSGGSYGAPATREPRPSPPARRKWEEPGPTPSPDSSSSPGRS
ncbi:alpha-1,6-mannosylglycoprotein 6-beta-N-acetylglucosaminyltransferase B [Orycteropus afer afer]|uniref:alpha-1,6-mannosyl-glycoprotein 6-beta-N-acetylglucosaminyltransferase n=1 Tax=Orycteropus afer afer TaxID=1230840 RepID=A0A8B7BE87_ORYAF|nr:alpha-1,6-mannosylglycoprotein 6-beta-N-acetylglucosaminyltransferase B [Orycteropus afer afer]